ncbi:Sugar kinase of the NBD/HSP70 family, may contain an N-terminal HTH domain [Pseudobutyrivibrio sp. YE44]|uniref:ROK family transcriptional regulator n=1 Tax=Pseudobutyrivibrio sp. YE44 TaxID=1520802 RepID=UPI000889F2BE|nr:ROK family transcriptional regulator [Pseudobutyrivibrio sp. YE44]SDB53545.1 Sugar kinase of the NBD/HSP70 family, may contain an N-terminal HTH domain [Pseudobutyrivibrio sp. YE44]
MKYQGINLENVKNNNRSAILHILNNEGAMSRKDIAKKAGLTAASVTLICNELIDEGIINELGEAVEEKRAGRKKILVDINPLYKYILCICIETDETYISITNLKGLVLDSITILTEKKGKPEIFLEKIAVESAKIMWGKGISKNDVLGAAVSVPGLVDREKGISVNSFSIWTKPVPVGKILSEKLGIRVVVENNLKTSAENEILFGDGKEDANFIILKWGPGVGSAIITDHCIYGGANGMSAEIGHVSVNKDGKPCNCGMKGCLETEISTHAIMDDIQAEYEKAPKKMPGLEQWFNEGNEMTYKNVDEWAEISDEKILDIFDSKIEMLAFSMRNYRTLLDPGKVILMGYMFDVEGIYKRFIQKYKEYDSSLKEGVFIKSENSIRENHIEPLATALNEWFYA